MSSHMPFAKVARVEAGLQKILRKENCAVGRGDIVIDHAVIVHIKTGQNRRAAR